MGARGAARGLTRPTQPREGRGYAAVVVSSSRSRVLEVSRLTPGLMVEAIVIYFRYRPLAADGFARRISSSTAW